MINNTSNAATPTGNLQLEKLPPEILDQFMRNNKRLYDERIEWVKSETTKINEFKDKVLKHTLLMHNQDVIEERGEQQASLLERIVKLNVGGTIFTTCLKTLLSEKDTFFSGFFSDYFLPQIQKVTNENGEECEVYFIDRNGKNFSLILDHLRGHKIGPKIQSLTGIELYDLVEEVAFYQIRSIYSLLNDEGKELLRDQFSIELDETPTNKQETLINKRLNITAHALDSIPKDFQTRILGETLFPLVKELQPDNCNKITGMLLEFDNHEILKWIEFDEELRKIVEEAVSVLQGHAMYHNN